MQLARHAAVHTSCGVGQAVVRHGGAGWRGPAVWKLASVGAGGRDAQLPIFSLSLVLAACPATATAATVPFLLFAFRQSLLFARTAAKSGGKHVWVVLTMRLRVAEARLVSVGHSAVAEASCSVAHD